MRSALWMIGALALAVVVVIGLVQAGVGGSPDPSDASDFNLEDARRKLAGAPAPLSGLHAQANQLLDGGLAAFDRRAEKLRGRPIVVNKWASWCGPCQAEFSIFQAVGTARGRQVGFLGLNTGHDGGARRFLDEHPLPFPTYIDRDAEIARALDVPTGSPMTVFIDRDGNRHVHTGAYKTRSDLNADIDRYSR